MASRQRPNQKGFRFFEGSAADGCGWACLLLSHAKKKKGFLL